MTFEQMQISNEIGVKYLLCLADFISDFRAALGGNFNEVSDHRDQVLTADHCWELRNASFVSNYRFRVFPAELPGVLAEKYGNLTFTPEQDDQGHRVVVSIEAMHRWYESYYGNVTDVSEKIKFFPELIRDAIRFFNHFCFPEFQFGEFSVSAPVFRKGILQEQPAYDADAYANADALLAPGNVDYSALPMGNRPPAVRVVAERNFRLPADDRGYNPLRLVRSASSFDFFGNADWELQITDSRFSSQDESPYFTVVYDASLQRLAPVPEYFSKSTIEVRDAYKAFFARYNMPFIFTPNGANNGGGVFRITACELISVYKRYLENCNLIPGYLGRRVDSNYSDQLLRYCRSTGKQKQALGIARIPTFGLNRPGFIALGKQLMFCNIFREECWVATSIQLRRNEEPRIAYCELANVAGSSLRELGIEPAFLADSADFAHPYLSMDISRLGQELAVQVAQQRRQVELLNSCNQTLSEQLSSLITTPSLDNRERVINDLRRFIGEFIFGEDQLPPVLARFREFIGNPNLNPNVLALSNGLTVFLNGVSRCFAGQGNVSELLTGIRQSVLAFLEQINNVDTPVPQNLMLTTRGIVASFVVPEPASSSAPAQVVLLKPALLDFMRSMITVFAEANRLNNNAQSIRNIQARILAFVGVLQREQGNFGIEFQPHELEAVRIGIGEAIIPNTAVVPANNSGRAAQGLGIFRRT